MKRICAYCEAETEKSICPGCGYSDGSPGPLDREEYAALYEAVAKSRERAGDKSFVLPDLRERVQ